MKKIDKFLFIFLFCLNYIFCYSSDINYEDLEELLRNNIISQDNVEIIEEPGGGSTIIIKNIENVKIK